MRFRPLPDHQLHALDELELVAYVAQARKRGESEHARRGVHMLLDRHEVRMRRRVGLRLPDHLAHHEDTVADWVLKRVMKSALELQVQGESIGEWMNWWATAVDRQVVSFWRSAQGQALEKEVKLASRADEDDDSDGLARLPDDFDLDRLLAQADYATVIAAVLGRMNAQHVKVVRMAVFEDQTSNLVADRLGESAANVDQVKSRFRRDVRAECIERGLDR